MAIGVVPSLYYLWQDSNLTVCLKRKSKSNSEVPLLERCLDTEASRLRYSSYVYYCKVKK